MKHVKKSWVKELTPGQQVTDLFLISNLKEAKTSKGDPFVIATLADKTGSIDVKMWGMPLSKFPHKTGQIVLLSLSIEEYAGKTTGKINGSYPSSDEPVSADFYKASQYDPCEMWVEFEGFLKGFMEPSFNKVAGELFDDESVGLFMTAPAATGMHHAFRHGLLEHTLQMLQIGQTLLNLPMFKDLNYDLCMFGIMFHDFGKIYEYSSEPGFKKRVQGVLVPHIPMVAARIYESANRNGVPEMVRDHMMHVVLAHHRLLEWGSPVKFACPEAAFVHYVDNLHGDVFGMLQKREEATEETIKHGYYQDSVTILAETFDNILQKAKGVAGGF